MPNDKGLCLQRKSAGSLRNNREEAHISRKELQNAIEHEVCSAPNKSANLRNHVHANLVEGVTAKTTLPNRKKTTFRCYLLLRGLDGRPRLTAFRHRGVREGTIYFTYETNGGAGKIPRGTGPNQAFFDVGR